VGARETSAPGVGAAVHAAAPRAPVPDQPAATLLVDLASGTVVFANHLATELAPGVALPMPLEVWSREAGLRTPDGASLEDGALSLGDVAAGHPALGTAVTAARRTDLADVREPMWVIGVPLTDAPPPLTRQSLLVVLPAHDHRTLRALQERAGDLHARAAMASELSFTISDPRRPDDPLVWVNPAFERVTGYSAADAVGRNCRFLQGPATDRAAVTRLRDALRHGETVADTLLNYRQDGTPFWNQVVISPVLDPDGVITHHVGIQADVTERVERERARDAALDEARITSGRLQLLAEVVDRLARHLDYADAVDALADVAVPALATWGFVTVTNDSGRIERIHIATTHPDARPAARILEDEDLSWLTRSPSVAAALASESGYVAEPFPVDLADLPDRTTPRQLAALRDLGLGSALVVPLRARDRVIGVLCLVHEDTDGFPRESVGTAAHLGQRAGLALDNVRLYLRERAAALTLQRSLLPEVPDVAGLDVAASYVPAVHRAQVGGDWFDVLPLPDGALGLAVGDVVGHDLQAAASMGQLRSVLRSYAWSGEPAGRVVAHLDELVRGLGMADIATCVYLRLERADGTGPMGGRRLTYTRAGHPTPLLRLPGGTVRALDGALTTPVGITTLGDPAPEAEELMPPGAVLVVYTDGLVERRDRGLRDGIAALTRTLAEAPEGAGATEIRDLLVERLVSTQQEDDVCLLVVRSPADGTPADARP
jgi:PAS domain S-box-containing protein